MATDSGGVKIDYIHIDCDRSYFNTKEQVRRLANRKFSDAYAPSKVLGSSSVVGLLTVRSTQRDEEVTNSPIHATGSTVTDPSGAQRKILALNIDYYVSGTIDAYRHGVEITDERHWNAGTSKITAGTPGHLYRRDTYGYADVSVLSEDQYIEVDVFDPVRYIASGGDPDMFTYPIITSDVNQLENYVLNGIIEPFPIRSVISNYSINFPFEPHATRAEFGNGNVDMVFASDQVVSVDDYLSSGTIVYDHVSGSRLVTGGAPFLDAVDMVSISTGVGASAVTVGQPIGYFSQERNEILPFEDVIHPRNRIPSSSYGNDLIAALREMMGPLATEEYVGEGKRTGTTGFVYDGSIQGTDSITYGGLLH